MDTSFNGKTSERLVQTSESTDINSLVDRAICGNFEAFDQIMVHYRERMYGVIYNMTLNHSDAADLTQETFVKAFRSLGKIQEKIFIFHLALSNRRQFNALTFLKRKRKRNFLASNIFWEILEEMMVMLNLLQKKLHLTSSLFSTNCMKN